MQWAQPRPQVGHGPRGTGGGSSGSASGWTPYDFESSFPSSGRQFTTSLYVMSGQGSQGTSRCSLWQPLGHAAQNVGLGPSVALVVGTSDGLRSF